MECRTLSRHSSLGSEAVMSVLYNAHSTQRMLSVAREMDIDPTFHKAKNTRTVLLNHGPLVKRVHIKLAAA